MNNVSSEVGIKNENEITISLLVIKKIHDPKSLTFFLKLMGIVFTQKFLKIKNICLEESCKDELENNEEYMAKYSNYEQIIFLKEVGSLKIDAVITIGGDGTILWALKFFRNKPIPPLISFDAGTIGYMCNFKLEEMEHVIHDQFEKIKNHLILHSEPRQRLQATILKDHKEIVCPLKKLSIESSNVHHALNDIVIERGPSPYIIKLDVYINNNFICTTKGDGLIIATPTGSTAYSLAAGGTIVHVDVSSILITPICPYTLSSRPLILPDYSIIMIKPNPECRPKPQVVIDGHTRMELGPNDALMVQLSDISVPMVTPDGKKSFSSWVEKLRLLLGYYNQ